ncbi:hypothetical protein BSKO_06981 [Bryopsis sp. KO-2023]|nr:hypothetical protein BSKO_06981 [Bryopsis sp. KO-2023]
MQPRAKSESDLVDSALLAGTGRLGSSETFTLTKERQDAIISTVSWRILPVCFWMTFFCFVDRTNLGLAADSFCRDIGINNAQYGTGVGLLFLGYALFQIPSNIVLYKVGAPLWLGFILTFWGVVALSMAFVTNVQGFYFLRFMLGVAESGAFPGMWFYFTRFFPENRLTLPYTITELGVKLSQVVAAPFAAALLSLGGFLAIKDWQWLFFLEGLPPIFLGFYIWYSFPKDPKTAKWLTQEESTWLMNEIALKGTDNHKNEWGLGLFPQIKEVVKLPGLWVVTLIKFLKDMTTNFCLFWTPLMIETLLDGRSLHKVIDHGGTCAASQEGDSHHSTVEIGLLTGVPFLVAVCVGIANGWHSQRVGERRLHMGILYMVGAVLFALLPVLTKVGGSWGVVLGIVCLTGGIAGSLGGQGILISLATSYACSSKAVGLAVFNSFSNFGGYIGPQITGYILQRQKTYTPAILFLAGTFFLSGVIGACLRDPLQSRKNTPTETDETEEAL